MRTWVCARMRSEIAAWLVRSRGASQSTCSVRLDVKSSVWMRVPIALDRQGQARVRSTVAAGKLLNCRLEQSLRAGRIRGGRRWVRQHRAKNATNCFVDGSQRPQRADAPGRRSALAKDVAPNRYASTNGDGNAEYGDEAGRRRVDQGIGVDAIDAREGFAAPRDLKSSRIASPRLRAAARQAA